MDPAELLEHRGDRLERLLGLVAPEPRPWQWLTGLVARHARQRTVRGVATLGAARGLRRERVDDLLRDAVTSLERAGCGPLEQRVECFTVGGGEHLPGRRGTDAWQRGERQQRVVDVRARLLERGERARLQQQLDLLLDRGADPVDLGEAAFPAQHRNRIAQIAEDPLGLAIGHVSVGLQVGEREPVGQLGEGVGNLGISHGAEHRPSHELS